MMHTDGLQNIAQAKWWCSRVHTPGLAAQIDDLEREVFHLYMTVVTVLQKKLLASTQTGRTRGTNSVYGYIGMRVERLFGATF